jgi:hypothetical protein
MMYTIDLLQGSGVPKRSQPGRVALAVIPFILPLLVSGLMAAGWKQKQTLIETERAAVEATVRQLEDYRGDLETYQTLQKSLLDAQHRLQTVNRMLEAEIPVSPLLLELVRQLPDSVVIQEIKLEYKPEVRKTDNPKTGKKDTCRYVRRNLVLQLAGPNRIESDQAVDQYTRDLRDNPVLSEAMQEIRIISRQPGKTDKLDQVLYRVECQLKEQKSEVL